MSEKMKKRSAAEIVLICCDMQPVIVLFLKRATFRSTVLKIISGFLLAVRCITLLKRSI